MSEREFHFNRRTLEDQPVYVRAATLKEARAKLRLGHVHDTGDPEIRKTTFRYISTSGER